MKGISIVIPAFNEEYRIKETLKKILAYFSKKNFDYEIIVVDDGSQDRTAETVKGLASKKIKLIRGPHLGKGAAVKLGVLAAKKNWILFTDADLSTPIQEIENFLPYIKYDILIGSRALKDSKIKIHQPFYRELGGKFINFYVRSLALPGIKDTQCGFKLFKKSAAFKIFPKQTIAGWGFDVEILYIARKMGLKIIELPVTWSNNPLTKVRAFKDGLKMMRDLAMLKLNNLNKKYE